MRANLSICYLSQGKFVGAGSLYAANLLQPAIDCCQFENFPNFRSNLKRSSAITND